MRWRHAAAGVVVASMAGLAAWLLFASEAHDAGESAVRPEGSRDAPPAEASSAVSATLAARASTTRSGTQAPPPPPPPATTPTIPSLAAITVLDGRDQPVAGARVRLAALPHFTPPNS